MVRARPVLMVLPPWYVHYDSVLLACLTFPPCCPSGGQDSALPLGDYLFYGLGGNSPDILRGAALYAKASAAGSPQAAYNMGYLVSIQSSSVAPRHVITSNLCSMSTVLPPLRRTRRRQLHTTTACWSSQALAQGMPFLFGSHF